jgi:copper chaperone NosL
MKLSFAITAVAASLLFVSCGEKQEAAMPAPFALTEEAMGRYCGMNVLEHAGPKGQIILQGALEAIWFTSARDTVAFTMLPDEPRDIGAIYVSDMGKAPDWERPGANNWVDAKKAFFVIGSSQRGGMGNEEAVPFAQESAAGTFARQRGGRVVRFDELPRDYILGSGGGAPGPAEAPDAEEPEHKDGHDHG